jgi:hypothetical protein
MDTTDEEDENEDGASSCHHLKTKESKVRNVSSRGPCKKNYQDSIFTLTKITNMSFLV